MSTMRTFCPSCKYYVKISIISNRESSLKSGEIQIFVNIQFYEAGFRAKKPDYYQNVLTSITPNDNFKTSIL
ncbi:hypothetical protein DCCM_0589 [Desulfocucumis palustris]|uniref:Uncharacterized protein n=1 Tax=Desulfocucumis palustris TaxID=1898651 RepID=A0A2L2X898_9FIRM|nr:hypothetical protein DCCM_0589 [Desulfocucumis palustris]